MNRFNQNLTFHPIQTLKNRAIPVKIMYTFLMELTTVNT